MDAFNESLQKKDVLQTSGVIFVSIDGFPTIYLIYKKFILVSPYFSQLYKTCLSNEYSIWSYLLLFLLNKTRFRNSDTCL